MHDIYIRDYRFHYDNKHRCIQVNDALSNDIDLYHITIIKPISTQTQFKSQCERWVHLLDNLYD